MEIIDTRELPRFEKVQGWHGCVFHAQTMTFGHWRFDEGATIHAHSHEQEEVWHVVEGALQATVNGQTATAGPGMVVILERGAEHMITALTAGFAIVADHPSRRDFSPV
jgi:quercetin dioxygenase-like cupin family protein